MTSQVLIDLMQSFAIIVLAVATIIRGR